MQFKEEDNVIIKYCHVLFHAHRDTLITCVMTTAGEVNNTDYPFIAAPVSGWDILACK